MLYTMPFGKFKGQRLDQVPLEYLHWLADLEDLRDPLLSAVEAELAARSDGSPSAKNGASVAEVRLTLPRAAVPVARELVQLGRRTAAQRHHPDTGGDSHRMVMINATADKLLAALGGAA